MTTASPYPDYERDLQENYDDLLRYIGLTLAALPDVKPGNDTAEGRLVFLCLWLRQEIQARRLPVPLDESYFGDLGHIIVETDEPVRTYAFQIQGILRGHGLIQPRQYEDLADYLDAFIAETLKFQGENPMSTDEKNYISELQNISTGLRTHMMHLPIDEKSFPMLGLSRFLRKWNESDKYWGSRSIAIAFAVYNAYFVKSLKKPPQPAPVPGLRPKALPAPF